MEDLPPTILVLDDDPGLRDLLAQYLSREGFGVCLAANVEEAERILGLLVPDAIVADVMMPGESGLSFARRLRQEGSRLPMLLLSAQGAVDDRVQGLEAGADDYLAKPFEPRELTLRLSRLLERAGPRLPKAEALQFGPYRFTLPAGPLTGEAAPRLTEAETALLSRLAQSPNLPVSRELLAEALGGTARNVDVLVTRLRKKIEADSAAPRYILTQRGQGYRLRTESA